MGWGKKWKSRSTMDELRVASEGSCPGSPQRRGTAFTGKWKREVSVLLPPAPRYLECLYADHREEVFRFFVCCFADDLKLYLERFFCGRKMTHSWYLIITLYICVRHLLSLSLFFKIVNPSLYKTIHEEGEKTFSTHIYTLWPTQQRVNACSLMLQEFFAFYCFSFQ